MRSAVSGGLALLVVVLVVFVFVPGCGEELPPRCAVSLASNLAPTGDRMLDSRPLTVLARGAEDTWAFEARAGRSHVVRLDYLPVGDHEAVPWLLGGPTDDYTLVQATVGYRLV